MTNGDPPEYVVRHAPGGWRVTRDAITDRERGLSMGKWRAPDEARQRWGDAVDAAAALVAQLVREKSENGPTVSRR